MSSDKNSVKVSIYGMEFSVRGGSDPDYTMKVARYVNEKMVEVEKSMQSKSTMRVAILAAMNVADELFQCKEELNNFKEDIGERSQRLMEKVTSRLSP